MSDKIEACVLCGVVPVQFHEHAPFTKCSTDGCAANSKRLYVIEHWNDRQRLIRAEARIKVLEEALEFYANPNNYSLCKGSYPSEFDCTADVDTYCGVKKIDGIDRHVVLHGKLAINALRSE